MHPVLPFAWDWIHFVILYNVTNIIQNIMYLSHTCYSFQWHFLDWLAFVAYLAQPFSVYWVWFTSFQSLILSSFSSIYRSTNFFVVLFDFCSLSTFSVFFLHDQPFWITHFYQANKIFISFCFFLLFSALGRIFNKIREKF